MAQERHHRSGETLGRIFRQVTTGVAAAPASLGRVGETAQAAITYKSRTKPQNNARQAKLN